MIAITKMNKKEFIKNLWEKFDFFTEVYWPIEDEIDYNNFLDYLKPRKIEKWNIFWIWIVEYVLDIQKQAEELKKLKLIKENYEHNI
jgi:hypothetical protein